MTTGVVGSPREETSGHEEDPWVVTGPYSLRGGWVFLQRRVCTVTNCLLRQSVQSVDDSGVKCLLLRPRASPPTDKSSVPVVSWFRRSLVTHRPSLWGELGRRNDRLRSRSLLVLLSGAGDVCRLVPSSQGRRPSGGHPTRPVWRHECLFGLSRVVCARQHPFRKNRHGEVEHLGHLSRSVLRRSVDPVGPEGRGGLPSCLYEPSECRSLVPE